MWLGDGEATYQVFTTYVQSDRSQTIPLAINGDDGHSLFVDDVFVGGSGFAGFVDHQLAFTPGQIHKISIVGYNGPGVWGFNIGVPFLPHPVENPVYIGSLRQSPGIRINSDGSFKGFGFVPSQLDNLNQPLSDVLQTTPGGAYATSFTTDSHAYTLQEINLAAHSFSSGGAEVRIRADDSGLPGYLVLASLGYQSVEFGGDPLVTYKSSGLTLAPNTKYWVTVGERSSGDFQWSGTFETAANSPAGWTIGGDLASANPNFDFPWQRCNCFANAGIFQVKAAQSTPLVLPDVIANVNSIQHHFEPPDPEVLRDGISSDVVGVHMPVITENFGTTNQYQLRLAAPQGYRFVVQLPPGASLGNISLTLDWENAAHPPDIFSLPQATDARFENLQGNMGITYGFSGVADGNGNVSQIIEGSFIGNVKFTGMTITSTYENRSASEGALRYDPVFGALRFSYNTATDSGQFVRLERIGDFNSDDRVDAADAAFLFSAWGTADPTIDLNGDSIVDAADAGFMFAGWTGDVGPPAVPEPTTGVLTTFLGGLLWWRYDRRRIPHREK